MSTLFVGIDVSKHDNEVLAMTQDGEEAAGFSVANDLLRETSYIDGRNWKGRTARLYLGPTEPDCRA